MGTGGVRRPVPAGVPMALLQRRLPDHTAVPRALGSVVLHLGSLRPDRPPAGWLSMVFQY